MNEKIFFIIILYLDILDHLSFKFFFTINVYKTSFRKESNMNNETLDSQFQTSPLHHEKRFLPLPLFFVRVGDYCFSFCS